MSYDNLNNLHITHNLIRYVLLSGCMVVTLVPRVEKRPRFRMNRGLPRSSSDLHLVDSCRVENISVLRAISRQINLLSWPCLQEKRAARD